MSTNINNYIQPENDDYNFENLKENKESSRYFFDNNNDNLTENFKECQNNNDSYDEKLYDNNSNDSICENMINDIINANSNKCFIGLISLNFQNNQENNNEQEDLCYGCIFKNTKSTTPSSIGSNINLLNKKRKPEIIQNDEFNHEEKNKSIEHILDKDIDENNEEELKTEKKEKKIKKKTGRKPKINKNDKKDKHTKFSDDNIMRKIKTKIFARTLKRLNQSIKFYSGIFLQLTPKMNVNLKKDLNMELLNRTIANIFGNTDLNQRDLSKGLHNKNLIEKIYNENKETETIKILSMTFKDVLNEIREKYLDDFLKDIQKKEMDNEKKEENENEEEDEDCSVDKYMNEVKRLLIGYEDWFKNKNGRNVIHREKK